MEFTPNISSKFRKKVNKTKNFYMIHLVEKNKIVAYAKIPAVSLPLKEKLHYTTKRFKTCRIEFRSAEET